MGSFRALLRSYDLTDQQWRAIRVLAAGGALEVSELAGGAGLLPPSLSRILRALESRGLVRREGVHGDSRRAVIRLTADGAELYRRVAPEAERIYESIEAHFGGRRLAALIDELQALTQALTQAEEGDEKPDDSK